MDQQTVDNAPTQPFDIVEAFQSPPCIYHDDTPLLHVSDLPQDAWTLRDAFEGVQVFGATGSGKTSGVGRALAHAFLKGGMGGLVLCAKNDEAETWQRYAQETGREGDILRLSPDSPHSFNFLEYELRRSPDDADMAVTNVVNMLINIMDVAARATSLSAPSAGDKFWDNSVKMLLRQSIRMLYATYGRVQLPEVIELLQTAPTKAEQFQDEKWLTESFFAQTLREFYETGGGRFPPEREDAKRLIQFWRKSYIAIPEKTRGNVLTTLETELDPLLSGRMRRLFCSDTSIVPELTHDGAVIVLDFPIKEYGDGAVMAQQIVKYAWQRATERRRVHARTRPVFLFADECQFFLSAYDMEYQSTARSARAATVYMTQNLPILFSKIGGNHPETVVHALIGNLRTKIFHTNTDEITNTWASRMVGKTTIWRETLGQNTGWSNSNSAGTSTHKGESHTTSVGGEGVGWSSAYTGGSGTSDTRTDGQSGGTSYSRNEQWDYAVEPEDFNKQLRSGGRRHGYQVTGVIMQAGRIWQRNRKHWMQVAFNQR